MLRLSLFAGLILVSVVATRGAETRSPVAAKAGSFITSYRSSTNIDGKLKALRSLEKEKGPTIDEFLLAEYAKLDGTKQPDAQLLGGLLRIWATRPEPGVLPYLIYEGLFHEDVDVVRACAAGIASKPDEVKVIISTGRAKAGHDPAEALMADLVQRLTERADTLPAVEKVLVTWSGRTRPGFKADANLKRKVSEKDHVEATEFWRGWFEQRFKQKLKPVEPRVK
jgi:hypothetical protein